MTKYEGACLCKQTKITIEADLKGQVVCHCLDCQQTSGSAFSTNVLVPKKDVHIDGPIKQYDAKAASGNTVTRVFCGNCGSAISHLSVAFGEAQAIQTGNFQAAKKWPVETELFVKDRWSGIPEIPKAGQVQAMPS